METRLFFLLGDLLAATVISAIAGVAAAALIGPGWNMVIAMFVGMFVGMGLALPGTFAFLPLFGAMEVMVPTMLGGMLSGMWIGMAAAMTEVSLLQGAFYGAGIGLVALVFTTTANFFLAEKNGL